MDKSQKLEFVRNFFNSVLRDVIIQKIESGQVPEDWDGHELRQWIADVFANEASHSPVSPKRSRQSARRRRAYLNTIIVNDLV